MERRIEDQLSKLEVVAKSLLEVIELMRSDLLTQPPYNKVQSEVRGKERPYLKKKEKEKERSDATGKERYLTEKEKEEKEKKRPDAMGKERSDLTKLEKPETTGLRRSERSRSELIRLKIEDLKRQSSPSNPLCFRCGKSGHLAYRCLNRILCYACGEHGHRACECDSCQNVHLKSEINQNQLRREQKIRETDNDQEREDLAHIEKQKVEVTSANQILSAVILKQAQILVSDVAGWGSGRIEEAFQQLVPNLHWKTRKINDNTYLVDAVGSLEDQKETCRGGEGKMDVEACCVRCGRDRLCKKESSGKVESVENEGDNHLMITEKEDGESSGKIRVEVAVEDRSDSKKQTTSNGNHPIHIDGLVQYAGTDKGDKEGRNTMFLDPVGSPSNNTKSKFQIKGNKIEPVHVNECEENVLFSKTKVKKTQTTKTKKKKMHKNVFEAVPDEQGGILIRVV